ncbi:Potassium transporter, partial [Sarracenia purpurea var. burkii]
MLVIWDTNIFLICGFLVTFVTIEGVYMTSLLNKVPQGGWVPFAISAFFLMMMLSWTYGRSKKSLYEAERKMSLSELQDMLSNPSLHRPPGICFFYTDLVNGIPPIIRHYVQHTNSMRKIMVVLTIRTLPIQTVLPEERLVVGKLGVDGVYRCLVQFGYKDFPFTEGEEEGDNCIASVVAKLREEAATTGEDRKLESAMAEGVVFVMGRTILRANKNNGWLARFTIDKLYRFFQKNCRSAISNLGIPPGKTMQVGMLYEM